MPWWWEPKADGRQASGLSYSVDAEGNTYVLTVWLDPMVPSRAAIQVRCDAQGEPLTLCHVLLARREAR